ncbi:MAG TPA: prepilin-type N-terminal cleavage/methylation domain-containing protein [Bdellovibrionales bacterium]|jgi:prepilin-type N-terminal cleavage/methylation domain-containing protein|nr:prepilin-type N-terminal cleavage/methylation domain-containing protein [Bdellovibrionales bacterium]
MRSNQKGYSLVEVMIAAGIVGIIAVSMMSAFPFMTKMNIRARSGGSCRAYLDAAFGRIEAEGFRGSIKDTSAAAIPSKLNMVPAGTGLPNLGLSGGQLHPQSVLPLSLLDYTNSDELTEIRTPGLITSSVTVVNALYRQHSPTICTSTYNVPGSSISTGHFLPVPPTDIQNEFEVGVKIQPYDLHQKRVVDCSDPGFDGDLSFPTIPAPKGLKVGDPSLGAADSPIAHTEAEGKVPRYVEAARPPFTPHPDYDPIAIQPIARHRHEGPDNSYDGTSRAENRNNLGFAVTLTATFKNKDPNDTSGNSDKLNTCTETRVIAFAADLIPPPPQPIPVVTITPAPYTLTSYWADEVTITFEYRGEPGGVLMCLDNSYYIGAAYAGPTHSGAPDFKQYRWEDTLIPAPRRNRWLPCERVTACGKKGADVAPGDITGNPSNYFIFRRWKENGHPTANPGLDYGCALRIKVVAVDPAGNVSNPPTEFTHVIIDP